MNNELVNVTWYQELLDDIRKLEYTGIVVTKWNIGKRLVEDEEKFGKPEYGKKRVENLAKDLGTSKRELYLCTQFAKKCDTVTQFKDMSWRNITHNILPEPRQPLPTKPLPDGKYNIIYADPPWQYYEGGYKNQEQHYSTMTLEEICNLPVGDLAADDCLLFMWVTYPMLDKFMDVLRCWGFEYSTVAFTWIKSNKDKTGFHFGLGNWTRANAEICVLARRGSIERLDASVSQIIHEPVSEHSEKPPVVRDRIIKLVGDLPRIELFAREKVEGWEQWGNEV